jgi:hypothetical protein
MKKGLLITVLVYFALQIPLKAQEKTVILHQSVGETIDKIEMNKYELFADYRNPDIEYFILITNNETNNLIGMKGQKIILIKEIDKSYILIQRENIEKLNNYYTSLSKTDSTSFGLTKLDDLNKKGLKASEKVITPEIIKSIKQNLDQTRALNQPKEREKNRRNGFRD